MKILFIFAFMLAASTNAVAATGWTGYRTILGLETHSSGIEIRLDGYSGACGSVNEGGVQKTWTKVETNQANEKQFVAILLMAFASGKRVSIYCASDAVWPTLSNVSVQNE